MPGETGTRPAEQLEPEDQAEDSTAPYNPKFAVALIVIASAVELIASFTACSDHECTGSYAFAVTIGSVSIAASAFLFGVLLLCGPETVLALQVAPLITLLLPILWSLGVAILTFHHPFNVVGNGYLATWFTFFVSFNHFTNQSHQAKLQMQRVWQRAQASIQETKCVMAVYLCSLIVAVEAATVCVDTSTCHGPNGWALAAALISTVIAGSYLFAEQTLARYAPAMAVFLAVWWIPGAMVLTFKDPFTRVGNGFFGAWGSLIGSALFACYATDWFDYHRSMARMKATSDDAQVFDGMAADELAESSQDLASLTQQDTSGFEEESEALTIKVDSMAPESQSEMDTLALSESQSRMVHSNPNERTRVPLSSDEIKQSVSDSHGRL